MESQKKPFFHPALDKDFFRVKDQLRGLLPRAEWLQPIRRTPSLLGGPPFTCKGTTRAQEWSQPVQEISPLSLAFNIASVAGAVL